MGKAFYAVLIAIPVVIALLVTSPLLLRNEIPVAATSPADHVEIEYTKHQLRTVSHGVAGRTASEKTEILYIKDDGEAKYTVTEQGYLRPDARKVLDRATLDSLKAIIKETGFINIPSESFPVVEGAAEYQKSNVKVTLNGQVNQVHWPEQNATTAKIPVIITAIEQKLDAVIDGFAE
ncbi:MAG: hypothetical protein MPI95_07795 [Nitrosopumilus sp.]|nr:hypothetical protein [Nitrosopumilus sp.]CAI9832063.1 conserved exported hypothetical protein [Nitrosopumilaceae archaeon]MDA7941438.1 hypothetical protein [Nitrosopumilus sp.]MDA7942844.1 hypothetical protein [Nitrosopumilus sp.]MDA7945425.1 hypothetical protein [Nitrosopumilus sp.]